MSDNVYAMDLTTFAKVTWDLKVSEEVTLHIRKPSEELLIRFYGVSKDLEDSKDDIQMVMDTVTDFLCEAFSNNRENMEITPQWFRDNEIDLVVKHSLFASYAGFIQKVMSDPNSDSRLEE